MNMESLKRHLPTLMGYLEKRQQAKKNQLPKHLQHPSRWPIALQITLNLALIITLCTLMINRYEYLSEAGPAMALVICLLLLIYSVISAFHLKNRYRNIPGHKLATLNFWLMGLAFLLFPAGVAMFLS